MPDLLVQAILPSGNPDFEAVNTFAFKTDVAVDATVRLDILSAVASFYGDVGTGQARAVGAYLSSLFDRTAGAGQLKMFDITGHLDGSPHGSPIAEGTITLPAAAQFSNLPPQVASVLTLRARDALAQPVEGPGDTRPRARRTGRIFIGPLNLQAATNPANDVSTPSTAFTDDCLKAAENLQDALVDGDYVWCVWSRTALALSGIERVEMDNSWDILRSRKIKPSIRVGRTFVPEPALVLGA